MCPPRPCATCPACLRTRRRAAVTQRPDALYADRGYDHDKYRKQVARLGSSRSSPVAASNMIPGWPCTAGSLSRVSPYCTGSAGSASDGKSATTSTKPSSASLAPSSAGDASTTSQTVRSSKACPRYVRLRERSIPFGLMAKGYVHSRLDRAVDISHDTGCRPDPCMQVDPVIHGHE
jgi:hypothetical protein